MAVRCLPLPDALRTTYRELQTKTVEQKRAYYRALLAYWEANEKYQHELDLQADQRDYQNYE